MTQTTDLIPAQLPSALPTPRKFDTRVSPSSLSELFVRDPEKLSDVDIMAVVTELRASRRLFEQADELKSLKEKKPKKSAEAKGQMPLNLDDLGL